MVPFDRSQWVPISLSVDELWLVLVYFEIKRDVG